MPPKAGGSPTCCPPPHLSSGPGSRLSCLTGLSLGCFKSLIWKQIVHLLLLLLLVLAGLIFYGSVSETVLQEVPLQAQPAPPCNLILC